MWSHEGLTDQIVKKALYRARIKIRLSQDQEERLATTIRRWCKDLLQGPAPMKPLIEDGDGVFIEDAVVSYLENNLQKALEDIGAGQKEGTDLMPRRFKTLKGPMISQFSKQTENNQG